MSLAFHFALFLAYTGNNGSCCDRLLRANYPGNLLHTLQTIGIWGGSDQIAVGVEIKVLNGVFDTAVPFAGDRPLIAPYTAQFPFDQYSCEAGAKNWPFYLDISLTVADSQRLDGCRG